MRSRLISATVLLLASRIATAQTQPKPPAQQPTAQGCPACAREWRLSVEPSSATDERALASS